MSALWNGVLHFGLVTLPIQLFLAVEEHQVRLRQVHTADAGRIRYRRFCEAEGREVPWEEIGRAWEAPDGRLVPLTDEDLDLLPLPTRRTVEVLGFVSAQDIDPISFSRAYYAGPQGETAQRPYALLVEALARTGYAGVAKVALRTRERLALVRPRHGVLVVQTLLWADELLPADAFVPSTPVTDQELRLAELLMNELAGIDITEVHDDYAQALQQLIDAKEYAGLATLPSPGPEPATVDLLSVLEESVQAARRARTGR